MSHFSVVVCTKDGPDSLEALLAPYDENREVAPYRDYEDGGPEDYWLYSSLKRADEDDRNGTGILPCRPDDIGWSSASSKKTPQEQAVDIAREAAVFRSLPEPVTWESLLDAHAVLYPGEPQRLLIGEDGRAYQMSTYSPDSKWDYWRIGGRWGGAFRYRPEFAAEVLGTERGWDSPEEMKPLHCDGGPKRALDLAAMRDEAAEQGRKTWQKYQAVTAGTPEAEPWSSFRAKLDAVPGYTIDMARADYHAQPRVLVLGRSDFRHHDDPIAEFAVNVNLYAERGRARAVPGFAVITLDGKWMAPGRMGWFAATDATDSTRIGYWEAANAYIDALPDDTYLIAVDCHV